MTPRSRSTKDCSPLYNRSTRRINAFAPLNGSNTPPRRRPAPIRPTHTRPPPLRHPSAPFFLLLSTLLLGGCSLRPSPPPSPFQHQAQLIVRPMTIEGRWEPASLSASLIVMDALEAHGAPLVIRHPLLDALVEESESPRFFPRDAPSAGDALEVRMQGTTYRLRLSRAGRTTLLPPIDAALPFARLKSELARAVRLPSPLMPPSAEETSKGFCLPPDAHAPFGEALLALLPPTDAPPLHDENHTRRREAAAHRLKAIVDRTPTPFTLSWAAFLDVQPFPARLLEQVPASACGRVEAMLERSILHARQGDLRQAALDIDPLLESHPYSPRVYLQAARLFTRLGMRRQSRHTYRRVLTLAPDWTIASLELAGILTDAGHIDDARAVLLEALDRAQDPERRARVDYALAMLATTSGADEEALAWIDRGLNTLDRSTVNPAPILTGRLLGARGSALRALGRLEEAEKALRAAVDILSRSLPVNRRAKNALNESLHALGLVLADEGRDAEAEQVMSRAIATSASADASRAWADLAQGIRAAGRPRAALDVLDRHREAASSASTELQALWDEQRAEALADLARWTEAASAFERAALRYSLLEDPRRAAQTWYKSGKSALNAGLLEEALERLGRARHAALRGGDALLAADIERERARIERRTHPDKRRRNP